MADRIGIFGGTFDPVHNGHLSIVNSFLNSGFIDEIWILPSPDPPHKTGEDITGYQHRKRMLELAFNDLDCVRISEVELHLSRPSYTLHTLRHLKQQYPDKKFYLCIGEDSLAEFDTWYKPEEIIRECKLLVAERPRWEMDKSNNKFVQHAEFVEHTPVAVSSTELRDQLHTNGEELEGKIPREVLDYIRGHDLYSK